MAQAAQVAQGDGWLYEQGDCLQLMRKIPDASVAAVITDPPYGSGGDTANARIRSAKSKYVSNCSYQSTLPEIDGDAVHPEQWVDNMVEWAKQARRVLEPDGVLVTFIDWRNGGSLLRILLSAGIRVRGMAVWDKGPGTRPNRGGLRNQAEYLLWGGVGKLPRDDVYLKGVFHHTTKTNGKVHITEKPLALMDELVLIARPGGLILDPFAGSNTTGLAALSAGYRYHGIESHPECWRVGAERIRAATET
jgi:site-specific DNA-methyltransferase (adenine-specific)